MSNPHSVTDAVAAPKRAALYLRVSTGRQAEGEVSLPSQRDLTTRYSEAQGWVVTAEFVEPGASATDDRRPVFQEMLEEAASPTRRFDVICVHAFSRFYRNGAEMELTIRRLRKVGVEVVSVTQPTGDDPSQTLMRQIIGIFDEYTSRENGKNVTRAMRESAKQGFWNGSRPPLGYRVVEAERRGSKIKKKLEIDPVEAELVRLIYQLYSEGDGTSGPLGVKDTTKWLNEHGYRTRLGHRFGVGPLHVILTNRAYAYGTYQYGVRNSRTGERHDPETTIQVSIPTIVPVELFEAVQARLKANNPKVTPPRIVNGPVLLTGLVHCASCGAGMTRTGTVRRGKSYSYYTCGGCMQKGKSECKGRHVPMAKLDTLVLTNIADRLLSPERVSAILSGLMAKRANEDTEVATRRAALEREIADKDSRLKRLYAAIEEGVAELDADLKARIQTLKSERDLAREALSRLQALTVISTAPTPEMVEAFSAVMREKLATGDTQAKKAWLASVISSIEVDDHKVRIIGSPDALAAAVTGTVGAPARVSGFVRKWRTRHDSNVRPSPSEGDALSS